MRSAIANTAAMRIFPARRTTILILAACSCVFALQGCKDTADEPAIPRNRISGVADGISFATTNVGGIKDSNDVFLLVGNMGNAGTFFAAFAGKEETEYPIAEEGGLVSLTNYLNDLIAADSFFIDTSALEAIFGDSALLLPRGSSYIFYIPEDIPFFSKRGNITLTDFDGSTNRIYGTFEGEFINAVNGPKYINAAYEDVFYLDCQVVNFCNF